MPGFTKTAAVPAPVTVDAPCDQDAETYDRHADALYRQALLTLGDARLAGQVVCDVIVDECVRRAAPAGDGDDASCRLALSAYRRCRELSSASVWQERSLARRRPESFACCIDSRGLLSGRERGALGLILFGGLGYARASRELGTSPADLAALVRGALVDRDHVPRRLRPACMRF
jgi:hypothetical protein